jgi:hypothetical protein
VLSKNEIQVRIDEHASEKISLQDEEFSLQNSKNLTAIPEITTEITNREKREEEEGSVWCYQKEKYV